MNPITDNNLHGDSEKPEKKNYRAPVLQVFGAITDMTQAGSSAATSDGQTTCEGGFGDMGKMCA